VSDTLLEGSWIDLVPGKKPSQLLLRRQTLKQTVEVLVVLARIILAVWGRIVATRPVRCGALFLSRKWLAKH
jgi:hypothetical protein